ncbi:MAG: hypothetical protein ABSF35_05800 [Polyangia bacterium]
MRLLVASGQSVSEVSDFLAQLPNLGFKILDLMFLCAIVRRESTSYLGEGFEYELLSENVLLNPANDGGVDKLHGSSDRICADRITSVPVVVAGVDFDNLLPLLAIRGVDRAAAG